jgi:hypothetical protein
MALAFIQGTMRAEKSTVAAYKKVNKAFGGRLTISAPYGAYRSRAQQSTLYNLFRAGKGSPANPPGTSNHEDGRALDVWNWAAFDTLRTVMKAHGFTRDPGEQWHYNYTGPAAQTAAEKITALISKRRKKSMSTLYRDDSTLVKGKRKDGVTVYALAGDGNGEAAWLETKSLTFAKALSKIHGINVYLSGATFAAYKAKYLN